MCNSFKAKVLNDQLCYEVDLEQQFKTKTSYLKRNLELGLVFFMDYNEDRQINFEENNDFKQQVHFVDRVDASIDDEKASIYLNTIGLISNCYNILVIMQ